MRLDPTNNAFEREVESRFGILPNFFRSAREAPELVQQLWVFCKAAYLDNPIPALFKERVFVYLSRFCEIRYCIVRHCGFLLGLGYPAGDKTAALMTVEQTIKLLKRPTPTEQDTYEALQRLEDLDSPLVSWPEMESAFEDAILTCLTLIFLYPARCEYAKTALRKAVGGKSFELLIGFLAFIRAAHYWTLMHPDIRPEEDVEDLLRNHQELAQLLLNDTEAGHCEMSARLFEELRELRALNEREELKRAKLELEEKDRQKDQFIAVLAHELRNPLSAISLVVESLELNGASHRWGSFVTACDARPPRWLVYWTTCSMFRGWHLARCLCNASASTW
jgi:hypothetical protein